MTEALTPEAYEEKRRQLASKLGGLIPLMEAQVASVDITNRKAGGHYVTVVFTSEQFDPLALNLAPKRGTKMVLFEDARVATPPPAPVGSETKPEEVPHA